MCGICGILSFDPEKPVDQKVLERMCDVIYHRGPDDNGIFITPKIGLGVRRLSIIDIDGGHQPIHNENFSSWIVFNGEIYNFLELREDLIKTGHHFYTRTDTEVILHLYEEFGEQCLEKLNGMFAFCIYDGEKLFLARDRFGEKPLYYAFIDGQFVFGSELKTILQHPLNKKNIDLKSVEKYLFFGHVPAPHTIFEGIKKLPQGSKLVLTKNGKIAIDSFWRMASNPANYVDESKTKQEILESLKNSISHRLISDVPLGIFLSGGVDSSLIANILSGIIPPRMVKAFTIGFEDKRFDETGYAHMVADELGITHEIRVFTKSEVFDVILKIAAFLDEPMADPSIVPTYLLSCFARQSVKVALSGDGGDELFGGYPKYVAHKYALYYDKIPAWLRKFTNKIIEKSQTFPDRLFRPKVKRFLMGLIFPPEVRNYVWIAPFYPSEISLLFGNRINGNALFEDIYLQSKSLNVKNTLDKMMYLDANITFPDLYLVKVDRASMACSLEVRLPFLDEGLVSLSERLPFRMKVKGATTKYILKEAARKLLPAPIIDRKKMGFGIPLSGWFRNELKPFALEILSEEKIRNAGIFNHEYVKQLLTDHFNEVKDNSNKIWALLIFQIWFDKWYKSN